MRLRAQLFMIVLVLTMILVFCGCIVFCVMMKYKSDIEERGIIVINKTTEIVPSGWGSITEYLILGNDSIVYRTRKWDLYCKIKIGNEYNLKTRNLRGWGYTSDHWIIEEVEEVSRR